MNIIFNILFRLHEEGLKFCFETYSSCKKCLHGYHDKDV